MTGEEAKASVREMANMMKFFEGTCELCGGMRKDCSAECVEKQLEYNLFLLAKRSQMRSLTKKNKSSNSDYIQCEYCHGTKILCSGAGQCDHDGKECNANHNCGEYTPAPCKFCMK